MIRVTSTNIKNGVTWGDWSPKTIEGVDKHPIKQAAHGVSPSQRRPIVESGRVSRIRRPAQAFRCVLRPAWRYFLLLQERMMPYGPGKAAPAIAAGGRGRSAGDGRRWRPRKSCAPRVRLVRESPGHCDARTRSDPPAFWGKERRCRFP